MIRKGQFRDGISPFKQFAELVTKKPELQFPASLSKVCDRTGIVLSVLTAPVLLN